MNKLRTKRIICTHKEVIKAPMEKIFSLLCPVEELKWIDKGKLMTILVFLTTSLKHYCETGKILKMS